MLPAVQPGNKDLVLAILNDRQTDLTKSQQARYRRILKKIEVI
jgi:hypothetical protein